MHYSEIIHEKNCSGRQPFFECEIFITNNFSKLNISFVKFFRIWRRQGSAIKVVESQPTHLIPKKLRNGKASLNPQYSSEVISNMLSYVILFFEITVPTDCTWAPFYLLLNRNLKKKRIQRCLKKFLSITFPGFELSIYWCSKPKLHRKSNAPASWSLSFLKKRFIFGSVKQRAIRIPYGREPIGKHRFSAVSNMTQNVKNLNAHRLVIIGRICV